MVIRFQNRQLLRAAHFPSFPVQRPWTAPFHPRPSVNQQYKKTKIQKLRVREFSKSVDIIKEGDDGDEIFVLEEGKIEVYYTEDDGSEQVLTPQVFT